MFVEERLAIAKKMVIIFEYFQSTCSVTIILRDTTFDIPV